MFGLNTAFRKVYLVAVPGGGDGLHTKRPSGTD